MKPHSAWTIASLSLLLSLLLSTSAFGQKIEFTPIQPDVLDARLQQLSHRNGERRTKVKALFEEAGCRDDLLVEQKIKGSKEPNVICTLPGKTDATIIVGAHFDTVPDSYGAVDNWSGASLLPSLWQSLKDHERSHTFVFIGFSAEEKGLKGCKFYAKQLTEDERAQTRAMVNLECLGISPTAVWVSKADKNLVNFMGYIADVMKLPVSGVDVDKIGTTDSASFAKIGIPAITIHALNQESLKYIHSSRDELKLIDSKQYHETYQLICGYLAYLDFALK